MKYRLILPTCCFSKLFYCFLIILVFGNNIFAEKIADDDEYLFSITQGLRAPVRIAIDNQDIVYVTDAFQKCIIKYDISGNYLGTINPGGFPIAVAINCENQIIVSDNNNGSINKLNSNGSTSEIYPKCAYPSSAVFDSDNNLYVVDSKKRLIIVMDLSGNIIRTIGKDILVYPTGLAYDQKNNRILVAEHGGMKSKTGLGLEAKILVFDLQGNLINSFGEFGYEDGQFSRIQGLTVDKWGRIYIVDPYQGTVSVFNEDGFFITKLAQFGKEPGQLNAPMDIVIDSRGRIWVTSMNNGSLEVFSTSGIGQGGNIISTESDLLQNYPNPFCEGTWIPFVLLNDETVTVNIYSINGAIIRTIQPGFMEKGDYTGQGRALYWDGNCKEGKPVENGIYFYELKLSNSRKVHRMIYLK